MRWSTLLKHQRPRQNEQKEPVKKDVSASTRMAAILTREPIVVADDTEIRVAPSLNNPIRARRLG